MERERGHLPRRERRSEEAAAKLQRLQERFRDVSLDDHSLTFNTELTSALELSYMLDVAEAIVAVRPGAAGVARLAPAHRLSGAGRREVPGALPGRPRREDGPPRIEYLPVTITRWPPGERVYGR